MSAILTRTRLAYLGIIVLLLLIGIFQSWSVALVMI
jgi:hypothetical protein